VIAEEERSDTIEVAPEFVTNLFIPSRARTPVRARTEELSNIRESAWRNWEILALIGMTNRVKWPVHGKANGTNGHKTEQPTGSGVLRRLVDRPAPVIQFSPCHAGDP